VAAAGVGGADGREAGVTWLVRASRAVWEFIVGDDPVTALGVAMALGATALIASAGAPAWWVMPLAAVALLALSLRRAAR
jgi:hypothetical protein